MTSQLPDRRLEIALRFLAERSANSHVDPQDYVEKTRAREPASSAHLDATFVEILRQLLVQDPARAEAWLRRSLADQPESTVPLTAPLERDAGATQERTPGSPEFIDRRYRILRLLGEGGQGRVYLVEDQNQPGLTLALKIVERAQITSNETLQRFKNQVLLQRELVHPGIPRVLNDGSTDGGDHYYTMEYVEGRTLSDVLRAEAPLEPERIARLTRQILDVLDYAHSKGAVHRDLKPGNIFLVPETKGRESVRVLDFGIAKIFSHEGLLKHAPTMHTESVIGTPHYMAPEQVANEKVSARTDLYALGIIIYQMCSGRLPFHGDTSLEIAAARLTRPPNPLDAKDASPALTNLVMRLLEKDQDKRPHAQDVRRALDDLTEGQARISRRIRKLAAGVGVLAVLAIGAIFRPSCSEKTLDGRVPDLMSAPLVMLEVQAPRRVFAGEVFTVELLVGRQADAENAKLVLDSALATGIGELRSVEDVVGGATSTIELENGAPFVVFERGERRRGESTFAVLGVTRRFSAAMPGRIRIDESRVRLDANSDDARTRASFPAFDIEVVELPPGAPKEFQGAIGTFVLTARAWPLEVEAGGALELILEIGGEGNFGTFPPPTVAEQRGFDAFFVTQRTDSETPTRSGSRTGWRLTPRSIETREIPPLSFVAFDPAVGRYATITTTPIAILVRPAGQTVLTAVDLDRDGDGTLDRVDGCPDDARKVAPGACGCNVIDLDTDSDGAPDCIDGCPQDPDKRAPGICGCGKPDIDADGDGVIDCLGPTRVAPPTIVTGATGVSGTATSDLSAVAIAAPLTPTDCVAVPGCEVAPSGFARVVVHKRSGIRLRLVDAAEGRARYVGEREVSWDEYQRNAGNSNPLMIRPSTPNAGEHPATGMSFADALDFCRRNGLEIPAADLWLTAVSPDAARDATIYPWGAEWQSGFANTQGSNRAGTVPTGSYPKDVSWCGVLDLAGNVREWCRESETSAAATLRGGHWDSDAADCARNYTPRSIPKKSNETIGMRVSLTTER